jgi:hypothetical protein
MELLEIFYHLQTLYTLVFYLFFLLKLKDLDSRQTNILIWNGKVHESIPAKKDHVGDIEIAYKILGKDDPILLFNGASDVMDA